MGWRPGPLGWGPVLTPQGSHSAMFFLIQSPAYMLFKNFKLSAMDALARVPMKDAAKCDTHCELQNSVNQQISERNLRLGACP